MKWICWSNKRKKVVVASERNKKPTCWGRPVDQKLGQVENQSWDVRDEKHKHCAMRMKRTSCQKYIFLKITNFRIRRTMVWLGGDKTDDNENGGKIPSFSSCCRTTAHRGKRILANLKHVFKQTVQGPRRQTVFFMIL